MVGLVCLLGFEGGLSGVCVEACEGDVVGEEGGRAGWWVIDGRVSGWGPGGCLGCRILDVRGLDLPWCD